MNLRQGFLRLTLVVSIIVGLAVATLWSKPNLHDFRWQAQTTEEKQRADKAETWFANHPNQFDPDMFLALGVRGQALKEHQWLITYEFFTVYFVLPFIGGFIGVWLGYGLLNYLIRGFHTGKA